MEYLDLHPFVRQTVQDKALGVIFGSALGDSIGLFTEFLSKQMSEEAYPERKFSLIEPVTVWRNDSHRSKRLWISFEIKISFAQTSIRTLGLIEIDPYIDKFDPATWTDDTDHAILILLSYLHSDGLFLTNDFAARLRSWCEQGLRCLDRLPLGLGRTVGSIVNSLGYLDAPESTAYQHWVKSGRHVAPNGSLMRTHPLGIMCLPFSREVAYKTAKDYSRVTHVDPRCVLSCCVCTVLISELLQGKTKTEQDIDEVLEHGFAWVDQEYRPDPDIQGSLLDHEEFQRHVYVKTLSELHLDDSMKLGYVYKCLGSTILCLRLAMRAPKMSPNTFEVIITDLVMQGGDADTNACCAGALLGAFFGYAKLPPHWRDGLMHRDWLATKVEALCNVVGISKESYSGAEDPDTQTDDERGRLPQEILYAREKMLVTKVLLKDQERRQNESYRKWNVQRERQTLGKGGKYSSFARFFGNKS